MAERVTQDSFLQKLKTVFNKSPEGMVISDMTQKDEPIIYCNDTFLNLTGYKRSEVVGRNCRLLQHDDTNQIGLQLIRAAIKAGESCRVVLRNYTKEGALFYNRLSLFPITDTNDTIQYYVGLQDDITTLILNKEQIKKLEKEKQILTSEVHHRVKNNLAVVSSLLDLEMNNGSPFEALQKSRMRIKSMAIIHENIYQLEGVSRVSFDEILNQITESYRNYREEGQPQLNYDIKAANVTLNINQAIPLSVIFSELIHNIYNHASEGKEAESVGIKLDETESSKVVLEVADDGRGIKNPGVFNHPETMGFIVVHTLANQLNADLSIMSGINGYNGFAVRIEFNKSDKKGSSQAARLE